MTFAPAEDPQKHQARRAERRPQTRSDAWRAPRLGSSILSTALLACGLGCSDDPLTCTGADCSRALPSIQLVDDTGQPALARGEQRTRQQPAPLSFDCTMTLVTPVPSGRVACENGLVSAMDESYPGNTVELRFQLRDGSFSEWRAAELAFTSHTDPDFNGPGCSCTTYTATATPVLVPAEARLARGDASAP